MAETWLKTYRTAGLHTFTAAQKGMHRFYVIGSGGSGRSGDRATSTNFGAKSGDGGAGGGYAVHDVVMNIGDTAEINISTAKSILQIKEDIVSATAGGSYTNVGIASGANGVNYSGFPGGAGKPGDYSARHVTSGTTFPSQTQGGFGADGAKSRGKYHAVGGKGGSCASSREWYTNSDHNGVHYDADPGKTAAFSDMELGGAGGGGGGGANEVSGGTGDPGSGAAGRLGGVVVEYVDSAPTVPPYIDIEGDVVIGNEVKVIWGVSTDVDDDLVGYALERRADNLPWEELYRGPARRITTIISVDWETIEYRVNAYDSKGTASGSISTGKFEVIHNRTPSAPDVIAVPEVIYGGSTITASCGRMTRMEPLGSM